MVVVIGKNRFGLVAEFHKELNVSRRAQHGAGVKFMGIGRRSFDLTDQRQANSLMPVSRTHGEQPDHAHAGHRPKAHGTDNRTIRFRHKNMLLSCILFQALKGFRGPAAYLVEAGIFTKRSLLHLEESRKISFGRWSDLNHDADPRLGRACHS